MRSKGQALVPPALRASLDGLVVRGPMVGRKARVRARARLARRTEAGGPRQGARGVARRYLAGHGPATDRDLARWAGIPLRDARAAFSAIAGELEELGDGLVDLKARAPAAELPPPQLLGTFEPVLLGWTSREDIFGQHKSS